MRAIFRKANNPGDHVAYIVHMGDEAYLLMVYYQNTYTFIYVISPPSSCR